LQADLEESSANYGGQAMSNMTGFNTLFYKEVLRFWKVATQTIPQHLS
jgi:hypothetical protein